MMYIRKYKIIFIYFKKNLAPNIFEIQPFAVCNAHDSLNPVQKKKNIYIYIYITWLYQPNENLHNRAYVIFLLVQC